MDDAKPEILTREKGIKENIIPTGRKFAVVPDKQLGLCWIKFIDGKGGSIPAELSGAYTGRMRAQQALTDFVTRFWDLSDSASKKPKVTNTVSNANAG